MKNKKIKKQFKAIYELELDQCQINSDHGNAIADLEVAQEKIIRDNKDNIQDIIKLLELLRKQICAVEGKYNALATTVLGVSPEEAITEYFRNKYEIKF